MDAPTGSAPIPRARIIEALRTALADLVGVRAAFLGGSDATGRTDALSDIDLVVIAEDDSVEHVLDGVRAALAALSPIAHRWRLPEPTWHGHAQEFLALRDAAPEHFVDLVVVRRSSPERFLEAERHGEALVLVDRDGLIHPDPLDRAALAARIDQRLATLRARFPLFQTLVTRAVARGFPAEAAVAYQDLTFRPLVELLRIRHCPQRFDYGARYLDRDLPAGLRAQVEGLALPGSLAEVAEFRERAEELFTATLRALDEAASG
jgi:predicted nucleotidyltransferase